MMDVRELTQKGSDLRMPDRWLTAGLNLNALTPFKAFALITTALAVWHF